VDVSRDTPYSVDQFPAFDAYLRAYYGPVDEVDGVILYERRADAG
jgi:hypothetical protein